MAELNYSRLRGDDVDPGQPICRSLSGRQLHPEPNRIERMRVRSKKKSDIITPF